MTVYDDMHVNHTQKQVRHVCIRIYIIVIEFNVVVQLSSNRSCDVFMYGLRRLSRVEVLSYQTLENSHLDILIRRILMFWKIE